MTYHEYSDGNGRITKRQGNGYSHMDNLIVEPGESYAPIYQQLVMIIGKQATYEWACALPRETTRNNAKYCAAIRAKIAEYEPECTCIDDQTCPACQEQARQMNPLEECY